MKCLSFKSIVGVMVLISLTTYCKTNNSLIDKLQGVWHFVNSEKSYLEVKNTQWLQIDSVFGTTTYQIKPINDSLFELEVLENKNANTYYQKGMTRHMKIKWTTNNKMCFVEFAADGKSEFAFFVYTDKKIIL
jgi:hypothetical protein